MMKVSVTMLFLAAAVMVGDVCEAAPEATNGTTKVDWRTLTPEKNLARRKAARKARYERGGGRVARPGTGKGVVTFVNCQTRAKEELIDVSADYFRFEGKLNVSLCAGTFDFPNPKIVGEMSLFVIDDEKMPPILCAPESRWAMVNVAPLAMGRGTAPAFFEARVKKELVRACAMLCGASDSQFPNALTGGIRNADDLDAMVDYLIPVDVFSRFDSYLRRFGVVPASYTTYKQACDEGWAAAPTNDVQRAIFERISKEKEATLKGPAKPRKIVFDDKKGE